MTPPIIVLLSKDSSRDIPMISFEIASDHVLFRLEWQNKQGFREMILPKPTLASEANLKIICNETAKTSERFANYTKISRIKALKRILTFAANEEVALPAPNSKKWDVFVNEHYIYHLSHPEKTDSNDDKDFDTMWAEWTQAAQLYKGFKHKHIIPSDTVIPVMWQPEIQEDEGSADVLDSVEAYLWPLTDVNNLWPKSYLVDKGLNVSTDRFLDTLQSAIEHRSQTIVQACEEYWNKVTECHRIGEGLINSISPERIEAVLESENFYIDGRYIADPVRADGAAWFLAVIDHYFLKTDQLKCISYVALKTIPFFKPFCRNPRIQGRMHLELRRVAGRCGAPIQSINETLNRLLGHLSTRDCGAAAAILIAENPRFNPHPLRHADYLSEDDKPIHYYNSELGQLMWSVSKSRARSRKVSALPPLSLKIYTEVVKATMKARIRLMLNGDETYRKLFITCSKEWVGLTTNFDNILTTKLGVSLYKAMESELSHGDVAKEIFSLKRIRGSQSLIAFLKEGTYQAASNTLGTSIAVVMRRYIPVWLKYRWNIRILRTFQTKLIILATKGRPWHQAATDFLTESELFNFIIREAAASTAHDPVSLDLKRYASELTEDAVRHLVKHLASHKMILQLDPPSLAAVFQFAEMFVGKTTRDYEDPATGLTGDSILTLAHLLHCTYEISKDPNMNGAIMGNIAGLSIPYFQEVYTEALTLKSELSAKAHSASIIVKATK
ncbi:hypothetical protein ALP03_00041 [Pseudomonas amygdali pv. tabaci]|uniref:Uncharacterized protein n=1 Tax=Pseudomonas amygdali pv. tabaci TaxID=322 RepID=A0A3M6HY53_PSEAJ|nr:hypothetical protein ALP03_00041 [Pseudomonas amygdali pv. tabaci]